MSRVGADFLCYDPARWTAAQRQAAPVLDRASHRFAHLIDRSCHGYFRVAALDLPSLDRHRTRARTACEGWVCRLAPDAEEHAGREESLRPQGRTSAG